MDPLTPSPSPATPHRPRPPTHDVVRGYLVLPHAVPILVVLTATAAFALVAAGGWPGAGPMAWLLGSMLGGQLAVGAVNELVDADLDAVSRPGKPIPAGLVSLRGARVVTAVGLAAMVALGLPLGGEAVAVCALGNGVGVAYSLWFKRTIWSWVPYLVALPLLPIWVWGALDQVDPGLLVLYPVGAAAVVAVNIAQSLPDVAGDRASGVRSLAAALGPGRAHRVCWAAMLAATGLASALAVRLTDRPAYVWLAATLAVALVATDALLWRRDARVGALVAFPSIALGAVALGVGWAAAIVAS